MKKTLFLLMLISAVVAFSGCFDDNSADGKQAAVTEQLMEEANRQVGMPNITNFGQKKTMKLIQEECDKADLICYLYLKSDYTGKLVYIGKCVGYGVPYSAQFTNPMKVLYSQSQGRITLPQADPNGLYMPVSSAATWIMLINPKTGVPKPAFFEPETVVLPFMIEE
jgi:hypothetical protein